MRSRAVSLPASCCLAMRSSPPPSSAARSRCSSSSRVSLSDIAVSPRLLRTPLSGAEPRASRPATAPRALPRSGRTSAPGCRKRLDIPAACREFKMPGRLAGGRRSATGGATTPAVRRASPASRRPRPSGLKMIASPLRSVPRSSHVKPTCVTIAVLVPGVGRRPGERARVRAAVLHVVVDEEGDERTGLHGGAELHQLGGRLAAAELAAQHLARRESRVASK